MQRRFTDSEVKRILALATEQEAREAVHVESHGDMTLAAIQEIGREAGIPDAQIMRAALTIAADAGRRPDTFLGLPITVTQTYNATEELSQAQWEALVVDLRSTFGVPGNTSRDGLLREWHGAEVRVRAEPLSSGVRIHLSASRPDARRLMMAGLGVLGFGAAIAATALATTAVDAGYLLGALAGYFAVGGGVLALGVLRIPRWARQRSAQMQQVVARLARAGAQGSVTSP